MDISLYMRELSVTTLGPFNRYVIWTQGCNKKCRGCISPDSWDINKGELISVEVIIDEILKQKNIEGITISGGEPFLQAESLNFIIDSVREKRDLGVIIYSGYTYEELKKTNDHNITLLLQNADLLIDGEYIEEKNDDRSLRGSSNQNVILLTERYKNYLDLYSDNGRKIELLVRNGKLRIVGVPTKKVLEKFMGV